MAASLQSLAVLLGGGLARAETGVTNIINGVTTNVAGPFNGLIVTNAGILNVTGSDSIIGNAAAAGNNFALVTGSGSVWSNRNLLVVGESGADNHDIVLNAVIPEPSAGVLLALALAALP